MAERYYDSRFSGRSGGIGRRARFRVQTNLRPAVSVDDHPQSFPQLSAIPFASVCIRSRGIAAQFPHRGLGPRSQGSRRVVLPLNTEFSRGLSTGCSPVFRCERSARFMRNSCEAQAYYRSYQAPISQRCRNTVRPLPKLRAAPRPALTATHVRKRPLEVFARCAWLEFLADRLVQELQDRPPADAGREQADDGHSL